MHTVSAREIQDWLQFYSVEPWGAVRDNMHAGMIAAMVFNVNRGERTNALTFKDFMLREAEQVKDNETQKFVATLRALAKPKKRK